jgi:hypothetical protein
MVTVIKYRNTSYVCVYIHQLQTVLRYSYTYDMTFVT